MIIFFDTNTLLFVYISLFLVTSLLYISFKTTLKTTIETFLVSRKISNYGLVLTILKSLPLILAVMFAYFLRSARSELYPGIIIGLLFCLLGDYFIDRSLIEGMLMFAIAHVFFIITFLYGIVLHETSFTLRDFGLMGFITFLIIIYDYVFLKYLHLLKIPEKYVTPITAYTILISLMLASSIWLAYTNPLPEVVLLPIGALFFVVSDSLIALREFSGKELSHSISRIMGTYFVAIFLISITTIAL